jgi:O-methyltransferase involved in polyketide biosynthesis
VDIDVTRPHVGRVYDYVLGGSYNYEVDRLAAREILARIPSYPRWARLNRSFLGHVGRRWALEGRTRVLDLGSGLPTQGHLNTWLPGAKILFVDNDPLAVAQGQQLLAHTPDVSYLEADVRDAGQMLAQAERFFGAERPVAVGCIGVEYFLTDDQLWSLMQQLHAFCAPGSSMAISFPAGTDGLAPEDAKHALVEVARVAGIDFYYRTADQIAELAKPWRMTKAEPLEALLDVDLPSVLPSVRGPDPLHHMGMMGAFADRM